MSPRVCCAAIVSLNSRHQRNGENRPGAFLMRTLRYKETLNTAPQYQQSRGNAGENKKHTHLYDSYASLQQIRSLCVGVRGRACLRVCVRDRERERTRRNDKEMNFWLSTNKLLSSRCLSFYKHDSLMKAEGAEKNTKFVAIADVQKTK